MADSNFQITLYTYHGCPYAHRVHIALNELGLPFKEVQIDLDKPREPWYSQINPRGLVPALKIASPKLGGEHILIESQIIVQFLADAVPDRLAPPSNTPMGAIYRARLNYFIDTWNTKIGSFMFNMFRAATTEAKEGLSREWVAAVKQEIEPLLSDAKPFYGGSNSMTLVEVMVAPFILRIYALAEGNVLPRSVVDGLNSLPNFKAWADVIRQQSSVLSIWDSESFVKRTSARIDRMKTVPQPKAH